MNGYTYLSTEVERRETTALLKLKVSTQTGICELQTMQAQSHTAGNIKQHVGPQKKK